MSKKSVLWALIITISFHIIIYFYDLLLQYLFFSYFSLFNFLNSKHISHVLTIIIYLFNGIVVFFFTKHLTGKQRYLGYLIGICIFFYFSLVRLLHDNFPPRIMDYLVVLVFFWGMQLSNTSKILSSLSSILFSTRTKTVIGVISILLILSGCITWFQLNKDYWFYGLKEKILEYKIPVYKPDLNPKWQKNLFNRNQSVEYVAYIRYPSLEVMEFYEKEFKKDGWVKYIEPYYSYHSSTTKKWSEFIDSTQSGIPTIYQLSSKWTDRKHKVLINLFCRYEIYNKNNLSDFHKQKVIIQMEPFRRLPLPVKKIVP